MSSHRGFLVYVASCLILLSSLLQVCFARNSSHTFCDGLADGFYTDPDRCDYFWKCWDNGKQGLRLLCPPNTLWNQGLLQCDLPSNVQCSNISHASSIPIWDWNGVLSCYGSGCYDNGSSWAVGIPCADGESLATLAMSDSHAWIPAPQGLALFGSQHWKIRFDSVNTSSWGVNSITASIEDYNPSRRIVGEEEGGPGESGVVMEGPQMSPQGCYYSVKMQQPELMKRFLGALLAESKRGGSGESKGRRRRKRSQGERSSTVWRCLESVPWAGICIAALCYATNMSSSLSFCGGFSTLDILHALDCLEFAILGY